MLVSFSVENFKSFAKKETLYMAKATKIKDKLPNNFFKTQNKNCSELLKIACIYGANSSGKTKFIEAVNAFCYFFQNENIKEVGDNLEKIYHPFQLNNEHINKSTTFEIKFIISETLYLYSISYDIKSILKEELIKIIAEDKNEIVYSIIKDKLKEAKFSEDFKESQEKTILKIEKQDYVNTFMRLFANDSESKLLADIFKFFKTKINVILCNSGFFDIRESIAETSIKYKKSDKNKNLIANILKSTCNSLKGFVINESEIDLEKEKLPDTIKKILQEHKELRMLNNIIFKHKNGELDIEDESTGTRIMFGLSGRLIELFEEGGILFVDELDQSLHPDILVYLIKLFQNKEINKSDAQMIFTAHNDILLDKFYDDNEEKDISLLRRDQVYFVSKDRNEASHLHSAVEYTGLQSRDSLTKLYRNGFFGARPSNLEDNREKIKEYINDKK